MTENDRSNAVNRWIVCPDCGGYNTEYQYHNGRIWFMCHDCERADSECVGTLRLGGR